MVGSPFSGSTFIRGIQHLTGATKPSYTPPKTINPSRHVNHIPFVIPLEHDDDGPTTTHHTPNGPQVNPSNKNIKATDTIKHYNPHHKGIDVDQNSDDCHQHTQDIQSLLPLTFMRQKWLNPLDSNLGHLFYWVILAYSLFLSGVILLHLVITSVYITSPLLYLCIIPPTALVMTVLSISILRLYSTMLSLYYGDVDTDEKHDNNGHHSQHTGTHGSSTFGSTQQSSMNPIAPPTPLSTSTSSSSVDITIDIDEFCNESIPHPHTPDLPIGGSRAHGNMDDESQPSQQSQRIEVGSKQGANTQHPFTTHPTRDTFVDTCNKYPIPEDSTCPYSYPSPLEEYGNDISSHQQLDDSGVNAYTDISLGDSPSIIPTPSLTPVSRSLSVSSRSPSPSPSPLLPPRTPSNPLTQDNNRGAVHPHRNRFTFMDPQGVRKGGKLYHTPRQQHQHPPPPPPPLYGDQPLDTIIEGTHSVHIPLQPSYVHRSSSSSSSSTSSLPDEQQRVMMFTSNFGRFLFWITVCRTIAIYTLISIIVFYLLMFPALFISFRHQIPPPRITSDDSIEPSHNVRIIEDASVGVADLVKHGEVDLDSSVIREDLLKDLEELHDDNDNDNDGSHNNENAPTTTHTPHDDQGDSDLPIDHTNDATPLSPVDLPPTSFFRWNGSRGTRNHVYAVDTGKHPALLAFNALNDPNEQTSLSLLRHPTQSNQFTAMSASVLRGKMRSNGRLVDSYSPLHPEPRYAFLKPYSSLLFFYTTGIVLLTVGPLVLSIGVLYYITYNQDELKLLMTLYLRYLYDKQVYGDDDCHVSYQSHTGLSTCNAPESTKALLYESHGYGHNHHRYRSRRHSPKHGKSRAIHSNNNSNQVIPSPSSIHSHTSSVDRLQIDSLLKYNHTSSQ